MENSRTISEWAEATFGPAVSNLRLADRAKEEMKELFDLLEASPTELADIAEECADIVICLARLVDRCGYDLWDQVESKMNINRNREWELDGTGMGYHK